MVLPAPTTAMILAVIDSGSIMNAREGKQMLRSSSRVPCVLTAPMEGWPYTKRCPGEKEVQCDFKVSSVVGSVNSKCLILSASVCEASIRP